VRSKNGPSGQDAETFIQQARRRQFIECTVESLVRLGFAGTTIAEVARRAGVSKSVVLYHFASRAELLEAVMTQLYDDARPQVVAAMDAAPSHRDRVLAYVRTAVHFAWTHQRHATAALEIARNLRRADGSPQYTARDNEEFITRAREELAAGQRAGEFGEFDTWTVAVLLRATIDALSEQFTTNSELDGTQVAEHLVDLVDRIITPRTPKDRSKS